eukprot:15345031-Ditylum_brightwellii.AAC.1
MAKYGELGNIGCYKEKGKHGGRWPAAGIQDQSRIAIKCKIIHVDTNANPHRFWAKVPPEWAN